MSRLAWVWASLGLGLGGCILSSSVDPACGDGTKDVGEQCDDGDLEAGDGCSSTCTFEPFCGDGIKDDDEECDDNNIAGGDGCSAICQIEPFCGDSTTDPGEGCDDGAHVPSDGCSPMCQVEVTYATTARWSFRTVASSTALACPTGVTTIQVISQALDGDSPVGSATVDLFDCATMTGTITPVYQGRYQTFLAAGNSSGTQVYATTVSAVVDLTTSDGDYTAAFVDDGGYFSLAWTLIGASSNLPKTCADAMTTSVSVLSTAVASPTSFFEDLYTCADGGGVTAALPAGTYTVSVSGLDASDGSLGTPVNLTDRTIVAPNKVTNLGTVTIPIDGL
ncbi:MAG: Metal dependent amidohydrolase [Myxococcales bacterium]|nr:Metal dependent amidohydrolase [Myxococcales bacterium]